VDDGHAASTGRELLAFARSLARTDQDNDTDKAIGNLIAGGMLVLGAVQTAISQFSSIALEEFRLDERALVGLVLLVQAVALPGALAVGWLSVRWGRRQATALCTAGWVVVLALAWFVQTPAHLYALAVLLALVLGGVQSAIRAAVAAAAPAGRSGVTFGLLQVGTKLAGAAASLAFGVAVALTGEARSGLVVLLAILLTGWWALRRAGRDG
jgi:UMF1 family MFS transporter